MGREAPVKKGIIDGSSRVLKELLRTPRFKETVRILEREWDPENAPALVRTLWEEDPEIFLGLAGALPSLGNAAVGALREILRHLSTFPPGMLSPFMAELVDEMDAEGLGEAAGLFLVLLARAAGEDEAFGRAAAGWKEGIGKGFSTTLSGEGIEKEKIVKSLLVLAVSGLSALAATLAKEAAREDSQTAKTVGTLADQIREAAEKNPEFMTKIVRPLVEAGREALAAGEPGTKKTGRAGDAE